MICFDEVPYQMVSETRLPLPVRNGIPGRSDFEYRREGSYNLFMFLQPMAGWGMSKSPISKPNEISLGTCRIWLKMAEVEISVMTEQCLDRRLGSQAIVASEVGAWEAERNAARATIDWRFTIPNAVRAVHAR